MGPHICIFPNQSLRSWLWKMQIYKPTFYRSLAQEEIVIAEPKVNINVGNGCRCPHPALSCTHKSRSLCVSGETDVLRADADGNLEEAFWAFAVIPVRLFRTTAPLPQWRNYMESNLELSAGIFWVSPSSFSPSPKFRVRRALSNSDGQSLPLPPSLWSPKFARRLLELSDTTCATTPRHFGDFCAQNIGHRTKMCSHDCSCRLRVLWISSWEPPSSYPVCRKER